MKSYIDTVWGYAGWLLLELRSLLPGRRRPRHGQVLMLSPFPPTVHGGVYRPLSFAKYARDSGFPINVITPSPKATDNEAGMQMLQELAEDVAVDYVRSDRTPSWRFFPRTDGGFVTAMAMAQTALRKYGRQPPEYLLCTAPDFCNFIAGYWLKKIWGCKLVLDYRDEWSQNPFHFVDSSALDRWWERRSLAAADLVVFTTESQKRLHETHFRRQMAGKGAVVLNGWDTSHAPQSQVAPEPAVGLEAVFAGNLSLHTMPGGFLRALEVDTDALPAGFGLTFIGSKHEDAVEQINGSVLRPMIRFENQIPVKQIIERLNKAQLLILIANEDLARYIPGKLYYYLASQTPILVYGHRGEAQTIVESLHAGVFIEEGDHQGLQGFLNTLAAQGPDAYRTGKRREWIDDHSRSRNAGRMFALIRERL